MLNFVSVSTSATAALAELNYDLAQEEREFAARADKLAEDLIFYDLHTTWGGTEYIGVLDVEITRENIDALEGEVAAASARRAEIAAHNREVFAQVEAYLREHPEDEKTASWLWEQWWDECGAD